MIYDEPRKDSQYVMLVDVAKGRGQDYSTFTVVDISSRPFKQVAVYRNNLISPMLFPDIIYKYANLYNEAYVIIENNDAGQLTCHGMHYELEYGNLHMESGVSSRGIGVEMNRRIKRIGCSGFKDLVEESKLEVCDEETIMEMSTFEAKGQSYEASEGNHDDLVMNLVLLGYFVSTPYFQEMTDINVKELMFKQRMREIEEDVPPFGFHNAPDDDLSPEERVDIWSQYDASPVDTFST